MMDYIDYNPYNGNVITKNDSFQLKQENPYENKNWVFGNSMRNSYDTKKINYNSFNQNGRNIIENRKDNNILILDKIPSSEIKFLLFPFSIIKPKNYLILYLNKYPKN